MFSFHHHLTVQRSSASLNFRLRLEIIDKDISVPDWAKSIFGLCLLLPGCPASPEGPGGPRAPGIPIRPGSPRDIITINKPEITDLQSTNPFKLVHQRCPAALSTYCILIANWPVPASVSGRWTSMTEEFCGENNSVTSLQPAPLYVLVPCLHGWLYSSSETARSQNMNLLPSSPTPFTNQPPAKSESTCTSTSKESLTFFTWLSITASLSCPKKRDC